MLGEQGTEQFTVTTRVDGEKIGEQKIHDPFIHTTIKLRGLRHAWNALTKGITVQIGVDGTHGAISQIMQMEPKKLDEFTALFCDDMAKRREANGVMGYTTQAPN